MRAGVKTLAYIKRMISMEKWRDVLPSTTKIAEAVSTSSSTVRKALRILENQRIIENNGSIGFSIIPKKFEELYRVNKQLYYLTILQRNIKIANLLDQGAKIIGNFAFLGNRNNLTVANLSSGNVLHTNAKELHRVDRNTITIDTMLQLNGPELKKAKLEYNKQQKISSFRELVVRHRKELGL